MNEDNRPIDPLKIAEKLRAVRNFELPPLEEQIGAHPEFVEVLWFLQWVSMPENYAGGLRRFCEDFVNAKRGSLGPKALLAQLSERRFTVEAAKRLVREFPEVRQFDGINPPGWRELADGRFYDPEEVIAASADSLARNSSPEALHSAIVEAIRDILPHYLRALCERSEVLFANCITRTTSLTFAIEDRSAFSDGSHWVTPPALLPSICVDLVAWMRERELVTHKLVAETSVTKSVRKWVERSYSTGYPVWLSGSCRWGKTETARNLAEARPGIRRMVETPDDNSQVSLCRAIAKALGIPCKGAETALTLRDKIAQVLTEAKLQLLFDEAHFLWPANITSATRPQRLDLVRRLLIDQGIPAVFISTPQSYAQSRKNLVRRTGFSIGQFEGRLLNEKPIELPEEITVEEKIAVAAIHFPNVSDSYLEIVVRRVSVSLGSSIYALIAKLAKTAQIIAQEHGRQTMIAADILEAANEILPSTKPEAAKPPQASRTEATPRSRSAADLLSGTRVARQTVGNRIDSRERKTAPDREIAALT